ncbi:hypothetical protein RvVAT039_20710 [Agrobacterium vitis]|nr:hypothetical protein RvVAT039_20710 [Agrobacterium vitis]
MGERDIREDPARIQKGKQHESGRLHDVQNDLIQNVVTILRIQGQIIGLPFGKT